jgi:hypothetical protein
MPDGFLGTRSSEGGGGGGRYASQRARGRCFGGFGSPTGDVETGGGGSGAGLMSWHGARVREEVVAASASSTHLSVLMADFVAVSRDSRMTWILGKVGQVLVGRPETSFE